MLQMIYMWCFPDCYPKSGPLEKEWVHDYNGMFKEMPEKQKMK